MRPVFLRNYDSVALLFALVLLGSSSVQASTQIPPKKNTDNKKTTAGEAGPKAPKRVISLAESIDITQKSLQDPEVEKVRRQYWKDTFDDIRKLADGRSDLSDANYRRASFLNQWKAWSSPSTMDGAASNVTTEISTTLSSQQEIAEDSKQQSALRKRFSSPRPPRFEGFPNWERLLSEWSEEIQEYLEKASEDSGAGYVFGNYGRAPVKGTTDDEKLSSKDVPADIGDLALSLSSDSAVLQYDKEVAVPVPPKDDTVKPESAKQQKLPMPAPAKPGEAVLPHTDISDRSKRLLIVTTASLPWRTGTAVNPLLRAAYLTKDRKAVGGSVALMLPWLEREEDQIRVYGANNTFATPEEQADYIRTWLRESAGMLQASEDLIIQWYTAWQNPVENSIYSMGDITALVSKDDVDICILEEPEHLNW